MFRFFSNSTIFMQISLASTNLKEKELCCGQIASLITFGGGRTKWAAEVKTPRPYVSRWLPPLRQESHLWNHQFAPLRTRYVVRVQRAKSVKESNKWVFKRGFLSWREISLKISVWMFITTLLLHWLPLAYNW